MSIDNEYSGKTEVNVTCQNTSANKGLFLTGLDKLMFGTKHQRTSPENQDFIIDPKEPKITFYDRKKTPLTMTLEQYEEIFIESFFLMLAFDIQEFELVQDILDIFIEETKIVSEFIKKNYLKLSYTCERGLSILDLAVLIKTGKI